MKTTTIQISKDLCKKLKARKIFKKESYDNIIWDLLENTMKLSEETKRDIRQAEKDIKAGKIHKLEDIKKELKIIS